HQVRGEPTLRVAADARWTLNAFAAGHASGGCKLAGVGDDVYKLLMEGLESFVATADISTQGDETQQANWAMTPQGVPYKTTAPHLIIRNGPRKERWWEDMEPPGPRSALPPRR